MKNKVLGSILPSDLNTVKMIVILLLILLSMSLLTPGTFLSTENLSSMSYQFPELGIISAGMMLALLIGGIDLSIVAIANLSSITAAIILTQQYFGSGFLALAAAVLLALAIGLGCGFINGCLISLFDIPPIIVTLSTQQIFMGLAIIITEGKAITGLPPLFALIGNGALFGLIPFPLLIFLLVILLLAVLLNRSTLGFKTYMMGSNAEAARYSGIKNRLVTIKIYAIIGLIGAIAGLILISRTNSAKADYGISYILQAILVCVMGGVSTSGGHGKLSGMVQALIALQLLSSGLNMVRISNFFKDFIWGAVLIVVMAINYLIDEKNIQEKWRTWRARGRHVNNLTREVTDESER